MNRHFFLALLCALTVLVAMTGCKKEPVADAVDNTPAADAPKADDAKPAADAPKADDAKPALSYKEAIDKATNVMQALSDAATGAGDNCEKMATDLTAALEKGKPTS